MENKPISIQERVSNVEKGMSDINSKLDQILMKISMPVITEIEEDQETINLKNQINENIKNKQKEQLKKTLEDLQTTEIKDAVVTDLSA